MFENTNHLLILFLCVCVWRTRNALHYKCLYGAREIVLSLITEWLKMLRTNVNSKEIILLQRLKNKASFYYTIIVRVAAHAVIC